MLHTNAFAHLQALLAAPRLVAGQISAVFSDGTALVAIHGAGSTRVRNPHGLQAGDAVFVQGDAITAPAPAMPFVEIEI